VAPVAVQDRYLGGYDLSTTFHGWPAATQPAPQPVPPPPPPPPPPRGISVQLLQVQQGNTGNVVRSLQMLLNGHGPYALAVDGVFGPKTTAAVRGFQSISHLGVDGVAGTHTWGSLLGVPQ
jgi:peptidoglycan hydrolase-like protein with peptidoglycan-binding domain